MLKADNRRNARCTERTASSEPFGDLDLDRGAGVPAADGFGVLADFRDGDVLEGSFMISAYRKYIAVWRKLANLLQQGESATIAS